MRSAASAQLPQRSGGPGWRKGPLQRQLWKHEAIRKTIHVSMLVLPAWVWWAPGSWRSRGLLLAFIAVLTADLLRRVWKSWARWVDHWALAYTRPQESRLWFGVHAMFVAAWILSWSVPRDIAVGSLCYGVFGDTAAALVGLHQKNVRSSRSSSKSLRGSLACLVTCLAVGWLLFPTNGEMILLGATAATLLERFSGPVDDNLTIPLGSALILSLVA